MNNQAPKPKSGVLDWVKYLDWFPKATEDVTSKSSFGAIGKRCFDLTVLVTSIATILVLYLSVMEVLDWTTPIQKNVVSVKHSGLGEQMKINFRITFTNLPCTGIILAPLTKSHYV
jgi:hypothetical protein